MRYAHPGSEGAIVSFKARYGNYIGGEFVPPVKGQHFTNTSPVNGQPIAEFPRSTAEDIDKALDAAHAAATSPAASAPRKAPLPRSTTAPWPTTSMSRWAWSGRSSRGTSRC